MVELLAVIAVLLILFSFLIINTDILGNQKKARDTKRLTDLATLDRAISEFQLDNQAYPDTVSVLRVSNVLPDGGIAVENAGSGWISQDLTSYMSRLPTDPINDDVHRYSYIHNEATYEVNARLEYYLEKAQEDGGNDINVFEDGNNLLLISP